MTLYVDKRGVLLTEEDLSLLTVMEIEEREIHVQGEPLDDEEC